MDKVVLVVVFFVAVFLPVYGNVGHPNPGPGSTFHDPRNVHNKEHLREHMNELFEEDDLNDQANLESVEEMEFHYFKLHDYDGNNKLDGLELGAAMTHFHEDGVTDDKEKAKPLPIEDSELAALVNQILKEDDLNDDGYVDYYEFMTAQQEKDVL